VRLRTVWFVHPRFAVRPSRGISPDRGQPLPGTRSQVKQKSARRTQLGAFSSGRLEPDWLPQRDTGRLAVGQSGRYGARTRPASTGRSAEHCFTDGARSIALPTERGALLYRRSAEHCFTDGARSIALPTERGALLRRWACDPSRGAMLRAPKRFAPSCQPPLPALRCWDAPHAVWGRSLRKLPQGIEGVGEGLSRGGYPADIKPWLEFLRLAIG
jgi:hypothetical protein